MRMEPVKKEGKWEELLLSFAADSNQFKTDSAAKCGPQTKT